MRYSLRKSQLLRYGAYLRWPIAYAAYLARTCSNTLGSGCREQEQPVDFASLRDSLFEDLDFAFLYDETYDGIELTELGEVTGITHPPFAGWFARFGPPAGSTYTEVHPYAPHDEGSASDRPSA